MFLIFCLQGLIKMLLLHLLYNFSPPKQSKEIDSACSKNYIIEPSISNYCNGDIKIKKINYEFNSDGLFLFDYPQLKQFGREFLHC